MGDVLEGNLRKKYLWTIGCSFLCGFRVYTFNMSYKIVFFLCKNRLVSVNLHWYRDIPRFLYFSDILVVEYIRLPVKLFLTGFCSSRTIGCHYLIVITILLSNGCSIYYLPSIFVICWLPPFHFNQFPVGIFPRIIFVYRTTNSSLHSESPCPLWRKPNLSPKQQQLDFGSMLIMASSTYEGLGSNYMFVEASQEFLGRSSLFGRHFVAHSSSSRKVWCSQASSPVLQRCHQFIQP